jgi:hypothetical protein
VPLIGVRFNALSSASGKYWSSEGCFFALARSPTDGPPSTQHNQTERLLSVCHFTVGIIDELPKLAGSALNVAASWWLAAYFDPPEVRKRGSEPGR